MIRKMIYSIIVTCCFYGAAQAAVSISFEIGVLSKRDGSLLDEGSYVAIFAELNTDGLFPEADDLLNETLTLGDNYGGSRLIGLGQTDEDGIFFTVVQFLEIPDPYAPLDLATGNELSFYWFDSTSADLTPTIGNDIDFGTFRSDDIDVLSGGQHNSTLPTDGSTTSIAYASDVPGSLVTASELRADKGTLSAVPEPTSMGLLVLSSALLTFRRKRKA